MSQAEGGQVRINLIFNILSLVANIGVGIFYTPYLVNGLGIFAYGILPLALIINQYISVVTGSLTSALTRFYSIALQKKESDEASKYLSTSLIVVFGLIIVFSIPLYFLVDRIEFIFTIPIELVSDAKKLFSFTIFSFFCSLLSSVFNITLYAYNRLDYLNVIKIIRVVGKFLFVFILFSFLDINIYYVGLANLLTELLILVFSIYAFITFSKGRVKMSFKNFSKTALHSVTLMAIWVMVQQIGDTGLYRVDTVLVNIFWSSKESGILGAFTELGVYSMIVASVIGSLFGPLILMAYSNNDHEKVKNITLDRSLSVGVLVAVMIGVLSGFSTIILRVWLGEEFALYSNWLIIKLFLIPFYSAAGVFAFAARAWNRIRFPAIATIIIGLLNFSIVYSVAKFYNESIDTVNVVLSICMLFGLIQSYFLNGLYFSEIYKGTSRYVWINFFKISVVLISVSFVSYVLSIFMDDLNDFLNLIIIGITGVVALMISVKMTLNKKQLNGIIELVYKQKNKK